MVEYRIILHSYVAGETGSLMSNLEMGGTSLKGNENTETNSRLRMWWLTWFKGYAVSCVRQRPRRTIIGAMAYTRLCKLEKSRK